MFGPQVTGGLAMADADARVGDRSGQKNKRRQASPRSAEVGYDRPVMRVFLTAATQVAGLQQLLARFVNGCGPVIHGTYQGVPVGLPGHERKMFANLDPRDISLNGPKWAANIFRGCRLQVPGVQMAGTANKKK